MASPFPGNPMMPPEAMGGMPPMMGMPPPMEEAPMDLPQAPPQGMEAPEAPVENISSMSIDQMIISANLAKNLKNKTVKDTGENILDKISVEIMEGIDLDEGSRADWIAGTEEAYKLALLIAEDKSYPWPGASNVKYPLIATSAMQFSARAYPALVPSDGNVVKARAIPNSINQMYLDSATRIAKHMSWQLMVKDSTWEIEMDKLLMTLSVVGSMFKKTYYDSKRNKNCSYIIYPKDFIVDYHATSLADAYRKTEVIRLTKNQIEEKIRNDEEFLDIDYGEPSSYGPDEERIENDDTSPSINKATPHIFYQCHTFYDLDEDGYEEPVIVTIHKDTKKVVQINARFTSDKIKSDATGKIISIDPMEYYTAFTFIENPSGSLYGSGFGLLLGPINEAVNTIINILIDAGHVNTLQSGFLSKTLRLNMARTTFVPGEWKIANATGEELKNGVVPIPSKEPSPVLMQLVQMLIQSGMQLASVAEIMVGKMPGQNTPATTTQQTVEQSMAVFTAVYKRVYRALHEEFTKLKYLNEINPDVVLNDAKESGLDVSPQDYQLPSYSIVPGADPTGDSQSIKQQKFAWILQYILPLGTIDPMALTQWAMEFMEIPPNLMMQQPQEPPPDPAMMKAQADIASKQQMMQLDSQGRADELEHKKAMAALEFANKQQLMEMARQKSEQDRIDSIRKSKIDSVSRINKARSESISRQIKSTRDAEEMKAKFAENRQKHALSMKKLSSKGSNKD